MFCWHRWGAVIIVRGAYDSWWAVRLCQRSRCERINKRKIIRGVI